MNPEQFCAPGRYIHRFTLITVPITGTWTFGLGPNPELPLLVDNINVSLVYIPEVIASVLGGFADGLVWVIAGGSDERTVWFVTTNPTVIINPGPGFEIEVLPVETCTGATEDAFVCPPPCGCSPICEQPICATSIRVLLPPIPPTSWVAGTAVTLVIKSPTGHRMFTGVPQPATSGWELLIPVSNADGFFTLYTNFLAYVYVQGGEYWGECRTFEFASGLSSSLSLVISL